jgi:hypothetical protein
VQRLEQTQPGSPVALTFRMSLALFDRDFARARGLIEEARRMSLNTESIALMEKQLEAVQHGPARPEPPALSAQLSRWALPAGGLGVVLAACGLAVRSKRRRPKATA